MTTEEKAKAYDEALERARKEYNSHLEPFYEGYRKHLEEIFPELAESEDERIRKEIVEYFKHYSGGDNVSIKFPKWIAYLETQKEIRDRYKVKNGDEPELTQFESELFSAGSLLWQTYMLGGEVNFCAWAKDCSKDLLEAARKELEQKPVEIEVYEVGKGTTICGQDYKCKKDYKKGNCWYIKGAIYHCGRDGYLTDQNGTSWSCTPEWFKEYIQSNTEWAEEEKTRFVSGQFLQCKLSFDDFKEGEHYWLEYVGDDTYVGRSDNILNQKFHITPRQLYTLFSQQIEETQKEQKPAECIPDSIKFDEGFKTGREVGFREGVESVKPAEWGDENKKIITNACKELNCYANSYYNGGNDTRAKEVYEVADKLKSLRPQPKQEWSEEDRDRVAQYLHDRDGGMLWSKATEITSDILDLLRPMSHWKPSEEQMDSLRDTIVQTKGYSYSVYLPELYEQLKKLM